MGKSHLKIISAILFFFCLSFSIKDLNAGIYFLEKGTSVQVQKNEKPCPADGYKITEAECMKQGLTLIDTCPADSRYGKSCSCDQAQFQYTTSNCVAPKSPTGGTCNGKYKSCECAPSVYKYYINADCPTNKVIDSKTSCTYADSKVGYSTCVCPSQYAETCSGNLEGVGTACDGKYVSCRCKSNFIDCGGQKGAVGASSCTDSEGTKYTNCQASSCEDGGFVSSIPSGQTCTPQTYEGQSCYKNCYRMITPVSFKVSENGNVILNNAVKGQISGVNEQTIIGGNYTDKTILVHRGETLKFSWAGATNYKLLRWELYRADAQQTTTIGTTTSMQFTIPLTYPTMQITAITEKLLSCEDGGFFSSIPEGQNCSPVTYSGLSCYGNCKCAPEKEICRQDCLGGLSDMCRSQCVSSCGSTGKWLPSKPCKYPLFANEQCNSTSSGCSYSIPAAIPGEGTCNIWWCGVKKASLEACVSYCQSLSDVSTDCSACKPITCMQQDDTIYDPGY